MIALALGMLAWASLAQAPDYDAFSDRDGNIATEQHHAAAYALVRNPEELEAVYSDAAKGNARARRVWQELEANLSGAGVGVAERSTRPECLVPVYRELSGSCRPDWSFLDYLAKDRPGATQLRQVVFDAFAARARQRGLENQAILAAASSLVAVGVAGAAVREAGVAAGAARLPEAPALRSSGAAKSQPPSSLPVSPGAAKGVSVIRNSHLAGKTHPKTGIPFDKNGFPDFSSVMKAQVKIKPTGSRPQDFRTANEAAGFKSTPEGYTWHHHQDGTTMQLVPTDIHRQTGHTGGFSLGQ